MKQQGYRVTVAKDGRGALESVEAEAIDLVLLDVLMPEMDGFTACEERKAYPRHPEYPVISMTALADTSTR